MTTRRSCTGATADRRQGATRRARGAATRGGSPPRRSRVWRRLHEQFVDVAPRPVLTRLEAADDRVARLVKVLRRVLVRRAVAAAHVAARQAQSQMHPAAARPETFLAARGSPRLDVADLSDVLACGSHGASRMVFPIEYAGGHHGAAQGDVGCNLRAAAPGVMPTRPPRYPARDSQSVPPRSGAAG